MKNIHQFAEELIFLCTGNHVLSESLKYEVESILTTYITEGINTRKDYFVKTNIVSQLNLKDKLRIREELRQEQLENFGITSKENHD